MAACVLYVLVEDAMATIYRSVRKEFVCRVMVRGEKDVGGSPWRKFVGSAGRVICGQRLRKVS